MTKLKSIWLDVIYQIRLTIAEKLIDITLSIMPNGPEKEQFMIIVISYFGFVQAELKKEGRITR